MSEEKKSLGKLFNKVKDSATDAAKDLGNKAQEQIKKVDVEGITNKVKDSAKDATGKFKEKTDFVNWDKVEETTKNVVNKTNEVTSKVAVAAIDKAFETLNKTGLANIGIDDIINVAIKIPGIKIDREEFLRKTLEGKYPQDVIDKAVSEKPLAAGIPVEDIDKLVDEVIKDEGNYVEKLSKALSLAGGAGAAAAAPANLAQYYGYLLRCSQKILYLYCFPQLDLKDKEGRKGVAVLTICVAIMEQIEDAKNFMNECIKAGASKDESKASEVLSRVEDVVNQCKDRLSALVQDGLKKAIPQIEVGKKEEEKKPELADEFKPNCERLKAVIKEAASNS